MARRIVPLLVCTALLFPFATEVFNLSRLGGNSASCCGTDRCNPQMPNCPYCPSPTCVDPYLRGDGTLYQPRVTSFYVHTGVSTLSDQGYVASIFRPPISLR